MKHTVVVTVTAVWTVLLTDRLNDSGALFEVRSAKRRRRDGVAPSK